MAPANCQLHRAGRSAPEPGSGRQTQVAVDASSACSSSSRLKQVQRNFLSAASMKNSALAANPCPTDLMGKQQVFLHMSAHYRRMYSAHSVVDSAPPASLALALAKGERVDRPGPNPGPGPKTRRRPHTAAECVEGRWPSKLGLPAKPVSAGSPGPGAACTAQQVLVRQSVRAQRSAQLSSKPIRIYAKPSRAETDPGRVSRRPLECGLGTAPRKPGGAPRPRPRKEHDKSTTFFDKLSQLAPGPGRMSLGPRTRTRTSSELLGQPQLQPHKPRILRTEVASRLRSSNHYCPPRPKSSHQREKLEVMGQELEGEAPVTQQATWSKSYSSPPVSSRDSAYNGGISSGGESRGPTPDQKNNTTNKRCGKKSDKKSINMKTDPKRSHSAEAKTRKRLEKRLRKKLLEDEREEIHGQRIKADTWQSVRQDDHGDEILDAEESMHLDSEAEDDDSFMEDRTPNEQASRSDQSVEEDMEEVQEETEHDSEDMEEPSEANEASFQKELVQKDIIQHSKESRSAVLKLQVGTQTEIQLVKQYSNNSSEVGSVRSKNSPSRLVNDGVSDLPTTSKLLSPLVNSLSLKSPPTMVSTAVSCIADVTNPSTNSSSKGHIERADKPVQQQRIASANTIRFQTARGQNEREQNLGDRKVGLEPIISKSMETVTFEPVGLSDKPYIRLTHDITRDIRMSGVVTNRAIKAVIQEHVEANKGKLNNIRMQRVVDQLCLQLQVPKDDHLDSINYGMGSALDSEDSVPLVSTQSGLWNSISHQISKPQERQPPPFPSQKEEYPDKTAISFYLAAARIDDHSQAAPKKETLSNSSSKTTNYSNSLLKALSQRKLNSNIHFMAQNDETSKVDGNAKQLEETLYRTNEISFMGYHNNLNSNNVHPSLISSLTNLTISGNGINVNNTHNSEVNVLPRKTSMQESMSQITGLNVINRGSEHKTFPDEMMESTGLHNETQQPVVIPMLADQAEDMIDGCNVHSTDQSTSSATLKASSRIISDENETNFPKGYAEVCCDCVRENKKCTCSSVEQLKEHFRKWESGEPTRTDLQMGSNLKLVNGNIPSDTTVSFLTESGNKSYSEDRKGKAQSAPGHDCRCNQGKQQSLYLAEPKPNVCTTEKMEDGSGGFVKGNEMVVTLFAPNENFASNDSMNEEEIDSNKMKKTLNRNRPKTAPQIKLNHEIVKEDLPRDEAARILNPDTEPSDLTKPYNFVNSDFIRNRSPDELYDILPFGTGINSDILRLSTSNI